MSETFMPNVTYAVTRECLGRWQVHDEKTASHNVMFMMAGECDFYINGNYHRLRAGDVSYCPRGASRDGGASTADAVIYAFDFELYGADSLPLDEASHFDDLSVFEPYFKDFFSVWYQKYDGYGLYCSGIFSIILSKLLFPRQGEAKSRHIRRIKEYIVDHLGEPITVEKLAGIVNLSPIYCGALFVKTEGVTIHEYVNAMRVNRAKDLLAGDPLPVSEIAGMVGFSDVFYFCKIFKRYTGVTPTGYRRCARG